MVADGLGTVYMEAPSSDGEHSVEAGPLTINADKLAFAYSSHEHSNEKEVKTIGCVVVDVGPDSIKTRLVYIDEKKDSAGRRRAPIATLPSNAPHPRTAQEAAGNSKSDRGACVIQLPERPRSEGMIRKAIKGHSSFLPNANDECPVISSVRY